MYVRTNCEGQEGSVVSVMFTRCAVWSVLCGRAVWSCCVVVLCGRAVWSVLCGPCCVVVLFVLVCAAVSLDAMLHCANYVLCRGEAYVAVSCFL